MHRSIGRAKFLSPLAGGTGEKSFLELSSGSAITGAADAHGGGPVTGKAPHPTQLRCSWALRAASELAVKTTHLRPL